MSLTAVALFPALQIERADGELALAVLDDYTPTAVEEVHEALLVFFPSTELRRRAREALGMAMPYAVITERDVDDEDWATRSQAHLPPVVVGALTILPAIGTVPPMVPAVPDRRAPATPSTHVVVIRPSMGFGTGHHATTRLCLAALQELDLAQTFVLDIGTGSGILALAARRLGARTALGIDCDADAVQSARENLLLNPDLDQVHFELADLNLTALPAADVVTANLTGALLCRAADALSRAMPCRGHLIVSGLLESERDQVREAFTALALIAERREDEWVGLCFRKAARSHDEAGRGNSPPISDGDGTASRSSSISG